VNRVAIKTHDLTRSFTAEPALHQLNLQVGAGEVFGILGPNGAGKTTLIRLLLGLLLPTSGGGRVLNYHIVRESKAIRARSGVLLQSPGLYDRLSAWQNLDLFGRIWRMPHRERTRRISELLVHLGMWERRNEPISDWNRGMQQKLAMARVLLHRPALLFLDEPTFGLDPASAAELRLQLAELAEQEGVTLVITTNNLAEAEQLCTRIAILRAGQLVATGTPDELRGHSDRQLLEITGHGFTDDVLALLRKRREVEEIRRGDDILTVALRENAQGAPLISLLVESGAEVEEVRRRRPTLESVYLTLVENHP
jgi:ABC-2 type transport system ATP-binding protein